MAPERLKEVYFVLVDLLEGPIGVMYIQLTDRRAGKHNPKALRFVGVDRPKARVLATLGKVADLLVHDARHQLWLRGRFGVQLVIDELGLIYLNPDDPLFHDRLDALGLPRVEGLMTMGERDYVRVEMQAALDPQEEILLRELALQAVEEP